MAILDVEREAVVVRIVYDGPPFSGKTTSVRALSQILGKGKMVFSPQESENRTLYFDWLEYIGGFFKGYSIACQIITVPGQADLHHRRRYLLQMADVVVFVLDASLPEMTVNLSYFKELKKILAGLSKNPVDILIQANKRDKPEKLTIEDLKTAMTENAEIKIVETTATLGKGIREAFVLAVRLAVERAERSQLPTGKPEIADGETLLTLVQQLKTIQTTDIPQEHASAPSPTGEKTTPILSDTGATATKTVTKRLRLPNFPDEEIPLQWIWPPLKGRQILSAVLKHPLRPRLQQEEKTWLINAQEDWCCLSKADWQYATLEEALAALRTNAQQHLKISPLLSEQRSLSLAQETNDNFRLWQIFKLMPLFSAYIQQILQQTDAARLATELFHYAYQYLQAHTVCQRCGVPLDLHLDKLGVHPTRRLVYLSGIDPRGTHVAAEPKEYRTLLQQALSEPISRVVHSNKVQAEAVLDHLEKLAASERETIVAEVLAELFVNVSE